MASKNSNVTFTMKLQGWRSLAEGADKSAKSLKGVGDAAKKAGDKAGSSRGWNVFNRNLDKTEKKSKSAIRPLGRLRTGFGGLYGSGSSALLAAGGIYGVGNALQSVTSAYARSQVSQGKLKAQLKASGLSYQDNAAQIDKVIQSTSRLAGLDDEDLQDAFTNIVRVTGNVNKSLKLTGLAADFARAKHMDVAKAGEIVGKVAGGNLGILSRYGIVLKKGSTSEQAIAELRKRFAGQAATYGKTQQGSIDRLSVAWENLQEVLGKALAPAITKVSNAAAKFVTQMQDGTGAGGQFVATLKGGVRFIRQHQRALEILGLTIGGLWATEKLLRFLSLMRQAKITTYALATANWALRKSGYAAAAAEEAAALAGNGGKAGTAGKVAGKAGKLGKVLGAARVLAPLGAGAPFALGIGLAAANNDHNYAKHKGGTAGVQKRLIEQGRIGPGVGTSPLTHHLQQTTGTKRLGGGLIDGIAKALGASASGKVDLTVNTPVYLDGKKVADNTSRHQLKAARHVP